MSYPEKTFELKISFVSDEVARTMKGDVRHWLIAQGVDSFVDGAVDSLDLDHNYDDPDWDPFADHGGELTPLLIYKYDRDYLMSLSRSLLDTFGGSIRCSFSEMQTATWTEGWKESFKPIHSQKFIVYPPWDVPKDLAGKFPLVIEPGMAFGTGQHATTQLCLEALENLPGEIQSRSLLDVGTGTGLLAIAACMLGYSTVVATDIDPDSVRAAVTNAQDNHVKFSAYEGSFPPKGKEQEQFDVVVANILAVVLKKLLPDLTQALSANGRLLMSGILAEEASEMIARAAELGLEHLETKQQEDWVAILLRRKT